MRERQDSIRRPHALRWLRLPVGVVAAALTVASCASLAGDGGGRGGGLVSGSGTDAETGAPLLQIVVAGGFVPMGYDFSRVPDLTVYGDGRAINQGPQILIWPGPALPNLLVGDLSDDDVAALVESAREAGLLGPVPDYGQPPVADAPTTVVTLTVDGETYVHAANALSIGDGAGVGEEETAGEEPMPGLSDDARAARVALAEFITGANELVGTAEGAEAYKITAFGVMARPAVEPAVSDDMAAEPVPGTEPELERQVIAWPVDVALSGATECVVVDGDAAQALLGTLRQASSAALYEQAGVSYDAFFRPLLPHEDGCDDLM